MSAVRVVLLLLATAVAGLFLLELDTPPTLNTLPLTTKPQVQRIVQPNTGTGTTVASPVVVRVACVGDSLTFGDGRHLIVADEITNPSSAESSAAAAAAAATAAKAERGNYPGELQRLLGPKPDDAEGGAAFGAGVRFLVRNFGVSGATMSDRGDLPYRGTDMYGPVYEFRPHLVVLMLGTNDSKDGNWPVERDTFRAAVADWIVEMQGLVGVRGGGQSMEEKDDDSRSIGYSFGRNSPLMKPEADRLSSPVDERLSALFPHRLIMMVPSPLLSSKFTLNETSLRSAIIPTIKSVAASYSIPVVDLNSLWPLCPNSKSMVRALEPLSPLLPESTGPAFRAISRIHSTDRHSMKKCYIADGVHWSKSGSLFVAHTVFESVFSHRLSGSAHDRGAHPA